MVRYHRLENSDVTISCLACNQVLQWNSSSQKWVNATVSAGGYSNLVLNTDWNISLIQVQVILL